MRHLHFTQSLEPVQGGGLGTSTVALHRQLLAMGIESTLCSTFGQAPQDLADRTMEFRRIKPDSLYFSPELKRKVERLVHGAELVHGHGLYVGTNYLFGREARRQRKPLVYHAHGFFEPWILNRSRWKKRLAHWLFEDANFRQVRLWRALTTKEADQIRSCGITTPVVVAPNGLSLEDFPATGPCPAFIDTPMVPQLTKKGPRLLFLSRLHPKKGLGLLLHAWERMHAEFPDWELVVAGPDERGHLQELQSLALALGLQDTLRFTGAVSGAVKQALLRSADLFVLPSHSEGFPMSLLEAMACSIPVVATRACNFPQITSSQAGWECDAELQSLLQTIQLACRAGETERTQRGRNGRLLVERQYTWPAILPLILKACSTYC